MRYATETEFIKAVDRIIDRKASRWCTDWEEISRSRFMLSIDWKKTPDVLIVWEYGTYLLSSAKILRVWTEAYLLLDYYMNHEREAEFYEIYYDRMQVIKRNCEYMANKYHIKYEK